MDNPGNGEGDAGILVSGWRHHKRFGTCDFLASGAA
jgi:hypothetical protein